MLKNETQKRKEIEIERRKEKQQRGGILMMGLKHAF